jgi:putative Holliday junction resolvase
VIDEQNLTFISFDFGTKRIGVAVGQTVTMTATPIDSLQAQQGVPHWSQISLLIDRWRPCAFVVGIPFNMDGSFSPITLCARSFAEKLRLQFSLPVYEIDERLTTVEARQTLFELGGYKALKRISVDSFAAKLILETWMRTSLGI